MLDKTRKRLKRKGRIRAKISGIASRPRLSVFRSNTHIFAQLIDDETRKTLVSASDLKIKKE
jgi:large subunit ribosomal protein L18